MMSGGHQTLSNRPWSLLQDRQDRQDRQDHQDHQDRQDREPVKRCDAFKIVVILDESGSMEPVRMDMIKALNDLINEQKQLKRPCKFTLVKFNDKVTRVIENRDLSEVKKFTIEDYAPDRSTALYDAIGSTIDWFRYENNVLLVIITDGLENASTKHNKTQIFDMLDEKKKYRDWTYVYLSNDLTNSAQGTSIGFDNSVYSANCVVGQHNFGSYLSNNMNKAIYNYRAHGQSVQSQLI
jgi:Mg-chelatase subunit ChlD